MRVRGQLIWRGDWRPKFCETRADLFGTLGQPSPCGPETNVERFLEFQLIMGEIRANDRRVAQWRCDDRRLETILDPPAATSDERNLPT